MTALSSSPDKSSSTKRPFGIIVAESYFVTAIAVSAFKLIADLEFYTRAASLLNLHFFHYFAGPAKISELVIGVLSVFAVVGLQRMRLWGRWLAIVLACASVGYAIWFYSAVLIFRMWTLVPHQLWPYVRNAINLGFGIYIVWYLLQPNVRHVFRPLKSSPASESNANS
jgi:hypothetical protein